MIKELSLSFLLVSISLPAFSQWQEYLPTPAIPANVECGERSVSSIETFKYCFQMNPNSKVLVVYFHGAGSTEQSLFSKEKPEPVVEEFKRSGQPVPSLVSVSIGRFSWLGTQRSNQYQEMASNVYSLIQDLRSRAQFSKVNLFGVSMGGFNGIQLLIHADTLFDRWVLACPAVTEANPFDDQSWDNDPDTKAAKSFSRAGLRYGLKKEFESSSNWNESNPMNTLRTKTFQGRSSMKVMVTTVSDDGFGFINAPVAAAKIMKSKGLDVIHLKTDGAEHCKPEPGPLAQFLLQ